MVYIYISYLVPGYAVSFNHDCKYAHVYVMHNLSHMTICAWFTFYLSLLQPTMTISETRNIQIEVPELTMLLLLDYLFPTALLLFS
jgi:hypothetical protein